MGKWKLRETKQVALGGPIEMWGQGGVTLHKDEEGGNHCEGSREPGRPMCGWWKRSRLGMHPTPAGRSDPWQASSRDPAPPHSLCPRSREVLAVLIKCFVWRLIKEKTVVLFLSSLRTPHYFYGSNNLAEYFRVFELGIASEPGETARPQVRDHSLPSKDPFLDAPRPHLPHPWASGTPARSILLITRSSHCWKFALLQSSDTHHLAVLFPVWFPVLFCETAYYQY